jgi:hypothetical protein
MLIFTKITQRLPLGAIGSLSCPVLSEWEPLARGEQLKNRALALPAVRHTAMVR